MEKKKSHLLGYGAAALFVALIIIFVIVIHSNEIPYQLTPEQTLAQISNKDNHIDPFTGIKSLPANTVFIDVRNPHDYNFSHFAQAINIPSQNILQEDYLNNLRELDDKGNTIILYAAVPQQAAGPWMLLKQIGIKNLKMYAGTYEQLMSEEPVTANVFNELPVIDTIALIKMTEKPSKVIAPKASAAKKEVVPLRTEPAIGGGC